MVQNKILNVTDLSSYLYCPRKFFLEKIKGIRKPANKAMVEGKIKHRVREIFSEQEKQIILNFNEIIPRSKIIQDYTELLTQLSKQILDYNLEEMKKFNISSESVHNQILDSLNEDINLRAESIEKAMQKGFLGESLWDNLFPKYHSEFSILSEKLFLKGRIDRLMISEEIIPFELKTRAIEKIYPSDEIQLTAYALLLEEKFSKPIRIGILEAGNKKHEIPITQTNKQKVLDLVQEIHNLTNNPKFPSSFAKCQYCDLKKECDELK